MTVRLIFVVLLVGLVQMVHAKPHQFLKKEQFLKLSNKNKNVYLLGLRLLSRDIERWQRERGMKVSQITPSLTWPLGLKVVAVAEAEDEVPCLFAGNPSYQEGELCKGSHLKGSCEESAGERRIQCNPLLFGENICVSRDNSATSNCFKSSPTVAEMTANWNWKEKAPELEKFQKWLEDYCRKDKQVEVCNLVENRLSQIFSLINNNSEGTSSTQAAEPKPKTDKAESGESNESSESSESNKSCDSIKLTYPVETGDENEIYATILEPWAAKNLMCTDLPLVEEKIQGKLAELERARSKAERLGTSEQRSFYLPLINDLKTNFENCIREARKLRASKVTRQVVKQGSIKNSKAGPCVTGPKTDDRKGCWVAAPPSFLGKTLTIAGITDVCAVEIEGASGSNKPAKGTR